MEMECKLTVRALGDFWAENARVVSGKYDGLISGRVIVYSRQVRGVENSRLISCLQVRLFCSQNRLVSLYEFEK